MAILDMRGTPAQASRLSAGWSSHLAFHDLRLVYWRVFKVASSSTRNTLEGGVPVFPGEVLDLLNDGYEVVGLKRHPLARLVSAFHYPGYSGLPSFKNFVRAVSRIPDDGVDKHVRSQTWRMPPGVRLFPIEDPTSWDQVRDAFRERRVEVPPLSRDNATSHGPWRSFYDVATERLARERYAKDLRLLGYE